MENLTRPIQIKFRVNEQEREVIRQRMALMGITNLAAYMRKISQDGFLYQVNFPELPVVCREIEAIGQNINQIAKRINSTDTAYAEDLRQIKTEQEEIWKLLKTLLSKLP